MGKPEQNNTGAVIAVIVVGLLLLMVVLGGAAVLVGGMFFLAYDETSTQAVAVTTAPALSYSAGDVMPLIEIDETGNISVDGEEKSMEELRTTLESWSQKERYVTPQLQAYPDCPPDVRAEVISACEEMLGTSPLIVESDGSFSMAPKASTSGETTTPDQEE